MSRQQPREAVLLQGTLDMLILKIVALGPVHGYAIAQQIEYISRDALSIRQGSLYPALYRLEERGWLNARWKNTDGGREAKFYELTAAGRRQLKAEAEGWARLCAAIGLILDAEQLA